MGKLTKDIVKRITDLEGKLFDDNGQILYDPGMDSLVRPIQYNVQAGLEFQFEDLLRDTKAIRSTQRSIEREIGVEIGGNIERVAYFMQMAWQRLTNQKKATLGELMAKQAEQLKDCKQNIINLYGACMSRGLELRDYCNTNDARIAFVTGERPKLIRQVQESAQQYRQLKDRFSSFDENNPAFYRTRIDLRNCKDRTFDLFMELDVGMYTQAVLKGVTVGVDIVHDFLKHGAWFTRKLYVTYYVAEECLTKVGPGTNLVRGLFKNAGVMYDVVTGVKTALQHGFEIESSMDSKQLLSRAYRELPSLPSNSRAANVLDYLNKLVESGDPQKLFITKGYGGR